MNVYTKEQRFVPGSVSVRGDRISEVLTEEDCAAKAGYKGGCSGLEDGANMRCTGDPGRADGPGREAFFEEDAPVIDGQGAYLIPGMIDIHFHGCRGYDFCDGTLEALTKIAEYQLSIGVTSICPAVMTLPVQELFRILSVAADFHARQTSRQATLAGINMEGPFISPKKKGAQAEEYMIPCDLRLMQRFQEAARGLVRFIGVAPEVGNLHSNLAFIRSVGSTFEGLTVSLAHTDADYDTAMAAFDAGARHVVHLYNAMSAWSHRAPGVVGAAADSPRVMAELICDGVHVHPAVVRSSFRLFGKDRLILISDSMRAAGMPDGTYTLGGQPVVKRGNRAVLVSEMASKEIRTDREKRAEPDKVSMECTPVPGERENPEGPLAGSVTTLPDCVRTAVKTMGIPLPAVLPAATINPAISLGIDEEYGTIEPGKKADLLLWKKDLSLVSVIKNGKAIPHAKRLRKEFI